MFNIASPEGRQLSRIKLANSYNFPLGCLEVVALDCVKLVEQHSKFLLFTS